MITYDLTGDKDYLTIVDKAKKTISKYDSKKVIKNQVLFPIVNQSNFTYSEISKYTGKIGQKFAIVDYDKNIKIYDKFFRLLKTLRVQNSIGTDGNCEAMTMDYKNDLLYYAFTCTRFLPR